MMAPLLLLLTEQVSTPEINVLNKTQENGNGTCNLTVACTVKKGDHVTYSWRDEAGNHQLSLANHSHLLFITLSNQHHDSIYNCTASNPVSSRSQSFDLSQECRRESSGGYSGGSLGTSSVANPMLTGPIALLHSQALPTALVTYMLSRPPDTSNKGAFMSALGGILFHLVPS